MEKLIFLYRKYIESLNVISLSSLLSAGFVGAGSASAGLGGAGLGIGESIEIDNFICLQKKTIKKWF